MVFRYPHAAKFGPVDLRKWDPVAHTLTAPSVTYVYAVGTTTRAALYLDENRVTPMTNNPVATGVPDNTPGVDAVGNLTFFAEADDYDVNSDGKTYTVRALPSNADVQASYGAFDPSTYVNF